MTGCLTDLELPCLHQELLLLLLSGWPSIDGHTPWLGAWCGVVRRASGTVVVGGLLAASERKNGRSTHTTNGFVNIRFRVGMGLKAGQVDPSRLVLHVAAPTGMRNSRVAYVL